jgi:hypothetical protein
VPPQTAVTIPRIIAPNGSIFFLLAARTPEIAKTATPNKPNQ